MGDFPQMPIYIWACLNLYEHLGTLHNPVHLVNIVFREWEQLYQEKPLKQMIEEARYIHCIGYHCYF